MFLTRIYLQNYRVFEDPVDLQLPSGLVGIYGANGAGKSCLIEAIPWALHGRSRTTVADVRTTGVLGDCVVEVEFEFEGHLYVVRRTISGKGKSPVVRAEAFADGQQVAEGAKDAVRYVESLLGMDDAAFRSSVFAEQKQLAAFSEHAPADRKRLVLQLLGVTPLDAARDAARRDARDRQHQFDQAKGALPDLDALRAAADAAAGLAASTAAEADLAEAASTAAAAVLDQAEARLATLDDQSREYERIRAEGIAARTEAEAAGTQVAALEAELAGLDQAASRLVECQRAAEGLSEAEARLPLVRAAEAALAAVAALPVLDPVTAPDPGPAELARTEAATRAAAVASIEGELSGARAQLDAVRVRVARADQLSGEADCPVCGQELGDAFEAVQAHHRDELSSAEGTVAALAERHRAAADEASAVSAAAKTAEAELDAARRAFAAYETTAARRAEVERNRDAALALLVPPLQPDETAGLVRRVTEARAAAEECARLRGRLERRPQVEVDLEGACARQAEASGRREALLEKIKSLGFEPEQLQAGRAARDQARATAATAATAARAGRESALVAQGAAHTAAQRVADATEQHERFAVLQDEAHHLSRLGELLAGFRDGVVAAVGPTLGQHASSLFAELTDSEYEGLDVDPETYEIRLRDKGIDYGMDRFSGSETDLANLSLRVAISEHIRFQSGGAVGLLVLDEVFGPLDDDRKERMLLALERLRSRFRQVLVVTHATEIKEQLPSAIEVVKLPGRRATARVI